MTGPVSSFQAVARSKVYTAIVEQILDNIAAGTFPPGSALPPERVLAEHLGVSRSSLREAVRVLEHARVLDVRGGSGTYVTEASLSTTTTLRARAAMAGEHSPLDLVAVRSVVEPMCAELAARWHHDKDLRAMEESLAAHEEMTRSAGDPADVDSAFHLAVAAASHNDVLHDIEQYFVELMHQQMWSELKHRSRTREHAGEHFLEQHRHIYEAIRAGDGDRARTAMSEHLRTIQEALFTEAAQE